MTSTRPHDLMASGPHASYPGLMPHARYFLHDTTCLLAPSLMHAPVWAPRGDHGPRIARIGHKQLGALAVSTHTHVKQSRSREYNCYVLESIFRRWACHCAIHNHESSRCNPVTFMAWLAVALQPPSHTLHSQARPPLGRRYKHRGRLRVRHGMASGYRYKHRYNCGATIDVVDLLVLAQLIVQLQDSTQLTHTFSHRGTHSTQATEHKLGSHDTLFPLLGFRSQPILHHAQNRCCTIVWSGLILQVCPACPPCLYPSFLSSPEIFINMLPILF